MTSSPSEYGSEIARQSHDPAVLVLQVVREDIRQVRADMVTRGEHASAVARLDAADVRMRADFEAHTEHAAERFDNVERSVAAGDREILSKIAEEHGERIKSRRWAIATTVATGGLAVSATALLLNYLT